MAGAFPDDLDLLRALDVLLRERHVTLAARRLGITQSAMSQRLGRLRAYFGDPLLVAGRPRMVPTARAAAMAAPLSSALAAHRAAVSAGAPFEPLSAERRFVLLGNDLVEARAMPLLAATVGKEAPRIVLSVERADETYAERLERGTADLAFLPEGLVAPSLRRLPLPEERFVVLMRKDHPLARQPLTLDRYLAQSHLLIAPRGMPGSVMDTALAQMGRSRRVAIRVQHFVTAPFVLEGSDLLLTCPSGLADFVAPRLGLRRRDVPLELPIDRAFLVWHERAHADAGHMWLRGRIEAWLRGARKAKAAPTKREV